MDVRDKVAIVTGGGRGFGKAIALALAKEGAHVVLASPDTSELEAVAEEIRGLGREALAVTTDISKKGQVDAMVKAAYDKFGHVDILINNGGVAIHNTIPAIKEEDFDFVMGVNLKGTLFCTQAVFPKMCAQKEGYIINIASTAGKGGMAKFGTYTMSKFGVMGLTEVTDSEGFQYGVKATAICPGAGNTQSRADNHLDDTTKLLQPEDIADLVAFLVKQPARAHIGEVIIRPQFLRTPPGSFNLRNEIE